MVEGGSLPEIDRALGRIRTDTVPLLRRVTPSVGLRGRACCRACCRATGRLATRSAERPPGDEVAPRREAARGTQCHRADSQRGARRGLRATKSPRVAKRRVARSATGRTRNAERGEASGRRSRPASRSGAWHAVPPGGLATRSAERPPGDEVAPRREAARGTQCHREDSQRGARRGLRATKSPRVAKRRVARSATGRTRTSTDGVRTPASRPVDGGIRTGPGDRTRHMRFVIPPTPPGELSGKSSLGIPEGNRTPVLGSRDRRTGHYATGTRSNAERPVGLEPTRNCLTDRRSAAELRPRERCRAASQFACGLAARRCHHVRVSSRPTRRARSRR